MTYLEGEENSERFLEWALLRFMRAIGVTLRELCADAPSEPAAAVLFSLSLDPMHRRAVRTWTKGYPERSDFFASATEARLILRTLRTGVLDRPAESVKLERPGGSG